MSLIDLLDTSKVDVRTLDLPVYGGSFFQQEPIRDLELDRRLGGVAGAVLSRGGLAANAQDKLLRPTLRVTVTPMEKIKAGPRIRELVSYAPLDAIFPTHSARVLRLFREILAEELGVKTHNPGLGVVEPNRVGSCFSPVVETFLRCAAGQDSLQVLTELWERARNTISVFRRRDTGGGANDVIRQIFRKAVLKMAPIFSASSRSIPPLIIGASDILRLEYMRSIASDEADAFAILASDGLQQGWVRGRGRVSLHEAKEVGAVPEDLDAVRRASLHFIVDNYKYRLRAVTADSSAAREDVFDQSRVTKPVPPIYYMVHTPFNTSEVALDPYAGSADRLSVLARAQEVTLLPSLSQLQQQSFERRTAPLQPTSVYGGGNNPNGATTPLVFPADFQQQQQQQQRAPFKGIKL